MAKVGIVIDVYKRQVGDRPVYELVGEKVAQWGETCMGCLLYTSAGYRENERSSRIPGGRT